MDFDLFAPSNLPGVGMGDTYSLVGIGGLIGLAVTSGALVAEGLVGTMLYVIAALSVLSNKGVVSDQPVITFSALGALASLALLRAVLRRKAAANANPGPAMGAVSVTAAAVPDGRGVRLLSLLAVALGGASLGYAWAEWNNLPFSFHSREALIGATAGLVGAAIGGHAADLFIRGSVRAGGSAGIVGVAVALVALVLNGAAFYVPFVGLVVFVLAIVVSVRLQRRAHAKYKGLRMLNG
ncbi:MAG: hypothetical protein H7123_06240 [Thermoleophilia bacterium]|nr:hypothetical protein [Thermoleophilia bacterium]